ncbi:hypothetical protein DCS_03564 [Drechmeria coniospora]|uniref:Uncharacterized protein n=1 Tax=Drechmeria coniospora TaxID=98403 RepID=A0A151GHI8_DRECN|nr:hypothetical protein DCS_03564 [Drechmeria coniospora]KYK56564.1 hypothetical protein DCS_03564 [Drechmeria coniospora]
MDAHGSSAMASSLRQAAFWVGLRQEVTTAVASRRSIKITLSPNFADPSFAPAADEVWTHRIMMHCAKVAQFCFGNRSRSMDEYRNLVKYDEGWLRARPATFLPLAYSDSDTNRGEVFPHILYLSHAVGSFAPFSIERAWLTSGLQVVGVVHSILAQTLLMCYDPTPSTMENSRKGAQVERDKLIQQQVLLLCGTALSNESTIPALITASLGIATFGDRFDDEYERQALLGVLVKTEADHGWPTGQIQRNLTSTWGRKYAQYNT